MRRRLITLTTIPPRFGGIVSVLESLLGQGADGVVLAVPDQWHRFPGHHGLPDLPAGVTLLCCEDLGPITKILPARAAFPDAELILCDDDCHYAPGWLDALTAQPGVTAGSTFDVVRLKRAGSVVAQGFAGLRIPPEVSLPNDVPEAVRWVDDLWLSAWIETHHPPIIPVPEARRFVTPRAAPNGLQHMKRAARNAAAAAYCHQRLGIWPPL